jgi:hypothetical protein
MLFLLAFIVIAVCVAALFLEGLWGNLITLVNVILAGLMAFNLFEPVAKMLDSMMPSYSDKWDFIALWVVFFLLMGLMRGVTDSVSKVKVRFFQPVEVAGGVIASLWVGWVMVCFTMASLHVAPLPRTSLSGSFMATPDQSMLGVGPDRLWLGLVYNTSGGSLSTWTPKPFDPDGNFIYKYAARRAQYEKSDKRRQ